MTLKQWAANAWLKTEPPSREEIGNLLAIVERDLGDAKGSISADWRFGIAYNAALKLCTILLRAEGYRPAHGLQHYRTLTAISLILGEARKDDADYLDSCRTKRNAVEYDHVGGASDNDAGELLEFAEAFRADVGSWLKAKHSELL